MQFNKNKSNPSILSIVDVVFTRKKHNFRKKASTIFFIKKRPGDRSKYYRLPAWFTGEEEAPVDCLLMLQSSSLSHEPHPSLDANCLSRHLPTLAAIFAQSLQYFNARTKAPWVRFINNKVTLLTN